MFKSVVLCVCLFGMTPLVLARPDRQQGKCGALKYKVAETYARTNEMIDMAISVNPKEVAVRNLLTLACQLREDYPAEREVAANIFNNERAAKITQVPTEAAIEISKGEDPDAYVATYRLNRQTGTETLTLVVDPNKVCGYDIEIDLRKHAVSIVACK
jgi:hypothetical protein